MALFRRYSNRISSCFSSSTTSPKSSGSNPQSPTSSNRAPTLPAVPIQEAPILSLPIELLQQITTYLSPTDSASFCLSARYICYAIGTQHLKTFLQSPTYKSEKRHNIQVLERAFPSHWYCAWCDRFHRREVGGGPRNWERERKRECSEFNGFLHAGREFVVRWHHVRLVVMREVWGEDYGIPISSFYYSASNTIKIFKSLVNTRLHVEAKIVAGNLILHSTFTITIPVSETMRSKFVERMWDKMPQIVVGHRNDRQGHTGLVLAVRQALKRDWKSHTQLCSTCAIDYTVQSSTFHDGSDTQDSSLHLTIETWRDLGNGRSPFDASWRAHGEIGNAREGFGGDILRLTNFKAGDIRAVFEQEVPIKYGAGLGNFVYERPSKLFERGKERCWEQSLSRVREVLDAESQVGQCKVYC
ncbi:hypothetical protein K469DRAFT_660980 [Zopfia rhizophila CBS 207.26]|uniref:F-box domain-containing protein n=1 Tax=Zopfia rhizophila CBS 207.26 TaxID=1314779 RepID=A0A6A6E8K3_9PEZI|nr:hypothetical protein K469DRAFT_660980 [Zopfia rhizophila CBS 207.26]